MQIKYGMVKTHSYTLIDTNLQAICKKSLREPRSRFKIQGCTVREYKCVLLAVLVIMNMLTWGVPMIASFA
jgi:hypothetical protein